MGLTNRPAVLSMLQAWRESRLLSRTTVFWGVLWTCILLTTWWRGYYILGHTLVEGWSIVIAGSIYVFSSRTRRYANDRYLVFLGAAYAAVAAIDFFHTMTYRGMAVFPGVTANEPTQLWIAARGLEASALFLSPFVARVDYPRRHIRLVFAVVAAVLVGVIMWTDLFPDCYRAGGLTRFKIAAEIAICITVVLAVVVIFRTREVIAPTVRASLVASMLAMIVSELLFTVYRDPYDVTNVLGHVFKGLSFYAIYRGVIVQGLETPFRLMAEARDELREKGVELQRYVALLHAALEAMPDGFAVDDLDGRLLVANSRFREWFLGVSQRSGTEGPGASFPDLSERVVGSEDYRERLDQLRQDPDIDAIDVLNLADGRILERSTHPFRLDGVVCGRAWLFRDISERIRQEQEIERQRREFYHVARVATVGELSASLAHELNQPLTAILANAEAALRLLDRQDPDLAEIRETVADIRADDRRAGEIIRRIRSLLTRGELETEPLDLNAVIGDVTGLVHREILERRVSLRLQTAADLPPVPGDRVQLQQVLMNLMLNASEALRDIPPDNRVLTVASRRGADGTVEIDVTDNGPGITPAELDRVFELFFTTKREGMGTGLAISRTIVQAHGGTISARNAEPCGAMFRIVLPVIRATKAGGLRRQEG